MTRRIVAGVVVSVLCLSIGACESPMQTPAEALKSELENVAGFSTVSIKQVIENGDVVLEAETVVRGCVITLTRIVGQKSYWLGALLVDGEEFDWPEPAVSNPFNITVEELVMAPEPVLPQLKDCRS